MVDGVTRATELTATRDVIHDIIISNISDPLTDQQARDSTDHWIFDGFPNEARLGKPAPNGWKFPIIEVPYPTPTAENKTVDGSKQQITHRIAIECHARSRRQANQLAQEIKYILDVTGQADLRKAALHGPDLISSPGDTNFIGGNKYYTKSLEIEFMRFD